MHLPENARTAPVRVPEITVYFWIVKILTTGAGESSSDFLLHRFNPILAAAAAAVVLGMALAIQFRMHRYVAWTYWFAVVMVAIFGTMAADVLHDGLHVPYLTSTIVLGVALAAIFAAWYRSEQTLSIHSITTRRREAFYWVTVIATFAVGTAAGDMTATTFGWGYLASGVIFAIAFAIVGVAHFLWVRARPGERHRSSGGVLAFWLAYILTRPFGASFADWVGKPPNKLGLGIGDGTVSIVLLILIAILVAYLAVSKKDVPARDDEVDPILRRTA
jgi:uncharacterized membrane-anchored protein